MLLHIHPARFGLPLLAALVIGCGASGNIEGLITKKSNGKPVVWGTVTVTGSDNIPHPGSIAPDGKYSIQGVPLGEVTITVSSPDPRAQGGRKNGGDGGRGGRAGGKDRARPVEPNPEQPATPQVPETIQKNWFAIHDKYADPLKTPLKATIQSGTNKHDIALED